MVQFLKIIDLEFIKKKYNKNLFVIHYAFAPQ